MKRESAAPGRMIEVDGVRVHLIEAGHGPETVLLLHGFGANAFSWRATIPLLAETHRIVAMDFPGFGFSDRRSDINLGAAAQAARALAVLDDLGFAQATVVGHSMGGGIAQRLALLAPERVSRLVLVASVDAGITPPWLHRAARVAPISTAVMRLMGHFPALVRRFTRRSLRRIVFDPAHVTAAVVDGYAIPSLIPGTAQCVGRMARDAIGVPAAKLEQITASTLVVDGERDRVVPPKVTARLVAAIPGARHVVIPRTGHLVPEEQPIAFVEALRTFFDATKDA